MIAVIFNHGRVQEVPIVLVRQVAQACARHEKKIFGVVEINLVDEKTIKKINADYRKKNQVTDVLSFAWRESGDKNNEMLGQIFICFSQIKKQAKEYKITVREEFARMLAHGLLHLAGHDHTGKYETKVMFDIQEKVAGSVK
ncbi:MAG: rRNA maturation RNase YbeY [Candidatus Magasanikbacteria bacterium]|jgi:probable rRNA maturation factor